MAKSRIKTLSELRRVRVDSETLMVYRCGKYVIQILFVFFSLLLLLYDAYKM